MKIQERTGAGNHRSAAPAQPAVGERLPSPPRERKPALAALAVLLILVGALGATMLVLRAGDRIEVIKVTDTVEAGGSVKGKIASVLVAADDSIDYVPWSQRKTLETFKAKSTIYRGTVVVGGMFTSERGLEEGKATVGLSLKEGQYPAGEQLKVGSVVAAYRVGDSGGSSGDSSASGGSNTLIVDNARVSYVRTSKGDELVTSTNFPVTLTVDSADAPALADAAAAGKVAIVLVPGSGSADASGTDAGDGTDGTGTTDGTE